MHSKRRLFHSPFDTRSARAVASGTGVSDVVAVVVVVRSSLTAARLTSVVAALVLVGIWVAGLDLSARRPTPMSTRTR